MMVLAGVSPTEKSRGHGCILVVEDEFFIRRFLADELREAGYQVIEASNADEALEVLQSRAPDAIISDVRMPGSIDGLGLLAVVRETFPSLPVIIMSGHLRSEDALAAGAQQFLAKPFTMDVAVEAICRVLDEPACAVTAAERPPASILIVDADILSRHAIADYLRHCGYAVVEAANTDEAFLALREATLSIDVIVCDIATLPSASGFELATWVRKNRPEMEVKLAGGVEKAAKVAADLCEVGPGLKRPYEPEAVIDYVKRLRASRLP